MTSPTDILIITASNGENLKLAQRFIQAGIKLGKTTQILDLTSLDLPLYNPRIHSQQGIPSLTKSLYMQMAAVPRCVI